MSTRKWAGNLDMYRKVPTDLMEGTRRGSILSYISLLIIVTLFTLETKAFLEKHTVTDILLDNNVDQRIRLNFNITMMDLKCDYAVVDVVSVLGTDQNITSHVTKWHVDGDGIRQRYQGRNKQQNSIELHDTGVTQTIEELHENGEDAISLDAETFEYALRENEYVFVDFYANWCSHCRQFAPTWETLAEVMSDVAVTRKEELETKKHEYSEEEFEHAKKIALPVFIGKVDCVLHAELCQKQQLYAYPTIRLFVDGEKWHTDYRGHRTVTEMADWLQQVEDKHKEELEGDDAVPLNRKVKEAHELALKRMNEVVDEAENEWAEKVKRRKQRLHHSWVDAEHPGCQLAGHLLLDRAPGNFHIQARSPHHDLIPHMTNVSHIVHSLSIGDPYAERMLEDMGIVPVVAKKKFHPMNGNVYITDNLHEAYHHYLKIVTTSVDGLKRGKKVFRAYQILQNSQLSIYRNDVVPEAKFIYDLSPIAISYKYKNRHWYDYLTSLMAIIGGTFTVFGMIESIFGVTANLISSSRKKRSF